MQFLKIKSFYKIISDIKHDESIPKYSSNLVYLSKANLETEIEGKIMFSIINKQPKRADHYWILHIDHLDNPSSFEYTFEQLIPDTLFRVNIRLGFRIPPWINLYFRQIVEELVKSKEFDLTSNYPSLQKNHIPGDFRFIIIHRVYNYEQSFKFKEKITMNLYNIIRRLGISDSRSFGLDTSNVMIETVPLIVNSGYKNRIKRVKC
jgi:KUP system potassium uptake protein